MQRLEGCANEWSLCAQESGVVPSGSAASNLDGRQPKCAIRARSKTNKGACKKAYITLSLGSAALMAEITSVRQERTFSVIPSLSIMIICPSPGLSLTHLSFSQEFGRTYAPAWRKVFARSINHFGSLDPADSSSSTDASPPAPHLSTKRCQGV